MSCENRWGGKRPGSGSKPGVKRGKYSGYSRKKPLKSPELRHRKLSLRLSPETIGILHQEGFDLPEMVRQYADLVVPAERQKPVKGGRKQVSLSVPPDVYFIIKSKANQSRFIEHISCNSE